MRVQSRAFFAFAFLSTLRHWSQFIFDDLLGFTNCVSLNYILFAKGSRHHPSWSLTCLQWSRCSHQHPTSTTPTPAPWLTQPWTDRGLSLEAKARGLGTGTKSSDVSLVPHAQSEAQNHYRQQLQQINTNIYTNDDVPQTNWLCEDWMGWTCSHMKVEVNGAWQKLSTWHAARKPDWQAEGRAENWVMQTYGPIWQDGNLKGRYRKVDHQFGLQLFIVRTKCKCWPTGSVGRRHKNQPRVQVALAYKIYARFVRGDRRMTPGPRHFTCNIV